MKLDHPEVIRAAVNMNTAIVQGQQVWVCRHTWDNVNKLKGLGLKPPLPRVQGWTYPGRYTPMAHQEKSVQFYIDNPRCFNLSDMGTGKTAASLWAAEWLFAHGLIKRVLIISPISVLHVWLDELFNINPNRTTALLYGPKQKRLDLLAQGAEYSVINHDGVAVIEDALKRANFDLIIGDEASAYRNYSTNRHKIIKGVLKKTPWVWLLTGTPTPNAPTDAYGLIKILNPENFDGGIGLFKELTMRKVSDYIWIPRKDASETVYKYLKPAIRFTKEECLDLPPLTYVSRECKMSDEQTQAFNQMRKTMTVDKEGGTIAAANAAVKLGKLLQLCCGVVKDNEGNTYYVEDKHRLSLLKEIIDEAGGKAIVCVPFIGVLHRVFDFLAGCKMNCAVIYGDTSMSERKRIFDDFQSDTIDVLIVQPQTVAHGVTLTAASTTIWYCPIFSSEQYTQLNARTHRKGQSKSCTVVHMGSTTMEWELYKALEGKIRMQDAVLGQYETLTH